MNKKEFIEALCNTLKMDDRSDVVSITYVTDMWLEDVRYEEIVYIGFASGAYRLINVTANSNGANAKEIINAIYGGEVRGLILSDEE